MCNDKALKDAKLGSHMILFMVLKDHVGCWVDSKSRDQEMQEKPLRELL